MIYHIIPLDSLQIHIEIRPDLWTVVLLFLILDHMLPFKFQSPGADSGSDSCLPLQHPEELAKLVTSVLIQADCRLHIYYIQCLYNSMLYYVSYIRENMVMWDWKVHDETLLTKLNIINCCKWVQAFVFLDDNYTCTYLSLTTFEGIFELPSYFCHYWSSTREDFDNMRRVNFAVDHGLLYGILYE